MPALIKDFKDAISESMSHVMPTARKYGRVSKTLKPNVYGTWEMTMMVPKMLQHRPQYRKKNQSTLMQKNSSKHWMSPSQMSRH